MMMEASEGYNYQLIIDELRVSLDCDFVSLAIAKSASEGSEITWHYASGNLNNRYKRIILRSGKGVAGIVFKTGKPMIVNDVKTEMVNEDLFNYPIVVSEKLSALIAIPLFQHERVTGVLLVGYRQAKHITGEVSIQLKQLLNNQLGAYDVKGL